MYFSRISLSLLISIPAVLGLVVPERRALACSPLLLVHAAGTTERGLGTVGTKLSSELAKAVNGATSTAVQYSTSAEYSVTVAQGARTAASLINAQVAACPDQRFVLSGYSKGAMVVHKTELSEDAKAKVAAVVVFGDPNGPKGVAALERLSNTWPVSDPSKVKPFCNNGDVFCDGGFNMAAHLAYTRDGSTSEAVQFIQQQL